VEGKVRGMAAATVSRTVPDPGGGLTVVPNGVVIDLEHIQGMLHAAITAAGTSDA
jgi:hypothetical protein